MTTYSSTSSASTMLEHGLLSEHTLDTPLTPLINASCIQTANSNEFVLSSLNRIKSPTKKSVSIVRNGNDAIITFPTVNINGTSSVELTLTNPTNKTVNWKCYPMTAAKIKTLIESEYSLIQPFTVFVITPASGDILPFQKITIKIEFNPRYVCGVFSQYWEIETRSGTVDSYNCKLVLNGSSSVLNKSPRKQSIYKNKENQDPQTSTIKKTIHITSECLHLVYPDVQPLKTQELSIKIENPLDRDCRLTVLPLVEPFYCKHLSLKVKSKHYVKVPIEFKPDRVGTYDDKVVIKAESIDCTMSCRLHAVCKK